jgi:hypothetical protein
MANGFPCPNPTCAHVFPQNSVAGVAALTCPRCGTLFQFRSGPAAAAPPPPRPATGSPLVPPLPGYAPAWGLPSAPAPVARPAAPPPLPFPGSFPPAAAPPQAFPGPFPAAPSPAFPGPYPAIPAAQAVPASYSPTAQAIPAAVPAAPVPPAADSPFNLSYSQPGVVIRKQRQQGGGGGIVIVLLVLTLLGGTGVYFLYKKGFRLDLGGKSADTSAQPAARQHQSDLFNYAFKFPEKDWLLDDETKTAAQANCFAMKRTNPTGWLALMAKDYKTGSPREDEMLDLMVFRMKQLLRNLEWEKKGETDLAGHTAIRVDFQGFDAKGAMIEGQAALMSAQGIAYGLLLWAPQTDYKQVAQELAALRGGFSLRNKRDNWVDKRVETENHVGSKAPYTLRDSAGIWTRNQDIKSFYKADLALRAIDKANPKDVSAQATVLVLLLPKADDLAVAVAAARDNLEQMHKKEYPASKVAVDKDEAGKTFDKDCPVGDVPGHIVKLRIKDADSVERFVVLAVVSRADHIIAIQCDSDYDHRDMWEPEFDQLLASFRLKGKK